VIAKQYLDEMIARLRGLSTVANADVIKKTVYHLERWHRRAKVEALDRLVSAVDRVFYYKDWKPLKQFLKEI